MAKSKYADIFLQKLLGAKSNSTTFWVGEESYGSLDLYEILEMGSDLELGNFSDFMDLINSHINKYIGTNTSLDINLNLTALEVIREDHSDELSDEEEVEIGTKKKKKRKVELPNTYRDTIIELDRRVTKLEFENGISTLFIGLPVVEGMLPSGELFRTPLFFIPAEFKYNDVDDSMTLMLLTNRIVVNLIFLSFYAMNTQIDYNFDTNFDYIDPDSIINQLYDQGLDFNVVDFQTPIEPFIFCGKDEFGFAYDSNAIRPNILIGMFDIFTNSIYWDFRDMVDQSPHILDVLLESKKNLLFDHLQFNNNFRTDQIRLFSNIDIFQQIAVSHSLDGNIVIEGPPGTGKSETIVNVLVNIALLGKRALFVADKRTALEVVLNRLGDISFTSIYIEDVNKQKEKFFNQFLKVLYHFGKGLELIKAEEQKTQAELDQEADEEIDLTENEEIIESVYDRLANINQVYLAKIDYNYEQFTIKDLFDSWKPIDLSFMKGMKAPDDIYKWCDDYQYSFSRENMERYRDFEIFLLDEDFLDDRMTYINYTKFRRKYNEVSSGGKAKQLYWIYKELMESGKFKALSLPPPLWKPLDKLKEEFNEVIHYIELERMYKELEKILSEYPEQSEYYEDLLENNMIFFSTWYIEMYAKKVTEQLIVAQDDVEYMANIYLENLKNTTTSHAKNIIYKMLVDKVFRIREMFPKEVKDMFTPGKLAETRDAASWSNDHFDILLELFPIHMMSIDTATKTLPLVANMYDYVIIDEASQVFLEKALTCLYRAKKYIIAGDLKQLQPTNVFQTSIEKQDYADDMNLDEALDAESLMQFYRNRARVAVLLKYHYRSYYNELIEFSNRSWYDGELRITNKSVPKYRPIIVHNIEGKWAKLRNEQEAEAIVERIISLTKTQDYHLSLGVITFNIGQANYITKLLDKLENKKVQAWRHRTSLNGEDISLFVKNIENVQGDERDVVLFSVGYDRKVSNYGSLSRSNGGNRLNVAITRAKKRIEVFKSEKAGNYFGFASTLEGPKLFIKWLNYCEQISESTARPKVWKTVFEFESVFEALVYIFLKQNLPKNYNIDYKVEEGSYVLDFVIYRGTIPILAIECDGKKYDTFSEFREGDIYRKLFLNARGWKFYRVWGPSWMKDSQFEKDKFLDYLIDVLEEASKPRKIEIEYREEKIIAVRNYTTEEEAKIKAAELASMKKTAPKKVDMDKAAAKKKAEIKKAQLAEIKAFEAETKALEAEITKKHKAAEAAKKAAPVVDELRPGETAEERSQRLHLEKINAISAHKKAASAKKVTDEAKVKKATPKKVAPDKDGDPKAPEAKKKVATKKVAPDKDGDPKAPEAKKKVAPKKTKQVKMDELEAETKALEEEIAREEAKIAKKIAAKKTTAKK